MPHAVPSTNPHRRLSRKPVPAAASDHIIGRRPTPSRKPIPAAWEAAARDHSQQIIDYASPVVARSFQHAPGSTVQHIFDQHSLLFGRDVNSAADIAPIDRPVVRGVGVDGPNPIGVAAWPPMVTPLTDQAFDTNVASHRRISPGPYHFMPSPSPSPIDVYNGQDHTLASHRIVSVNSVDVYPHSASVSPAGYMFISESATVDDAFPLVGPANHAVQPQPAVGGEQCPLQPWEEPHQPAAVCTPEYKKLAGHLSEWAASLLLRLMRGQNVDATLSLDSILHRQEYVDAPAALVDNIRWCLMSTLLSPSAVFMAIYFICRLPVFTDIGAPPSAAILRFRRVLFGEGGSYASVPREYELFAPFKLFVNGILLASKMLDDATFSNRVWHEISQVPIQSINALELSSLELLQYDLTVPAEHWNRWLGVLRGYHMHRAPYPAPIGPARETPHGAILHVFNTLLTANTLRPPNSADGPVFLGIEERISARLKVLRVWFDVLDDDLDEDGPLRDEYRSRPRGDVSAQHDPRMPPANLPPPAEWLPEADPIIVVPRRSARVPPPAEDYHAVAQHMQYVSMNCGYPLGDNGSPFETYYAPPADPYSGHPAYHAGCLTATCCY